MSTRFFLPEVLVWSAETVSLSSVPVQDVCFTTGMTGCLPWKDPWHLLYIYSQLSFNLKQLKGEPSWLHLTFWVVHCWSLCPGVLAKKRCPWAAWLAGLDHINLGLQLIFFCLMGQDLWGKINWSWEKDGALWWQLLCCEEKFDQKKGTAKRSGFGEQPWSYLSAWFGKVREMLSDGHQSPKGHWAARKPGRPAQKMDPWLEGIALLLYHLPSEFSALREGEKRRKQISIGNVSCTWCTPHCRRDWRGLTRE